jgi:hypothetical protein
MAHLRASGDFSDCVLVVGSGENVEVCILSLYDNVLSYVVYLRTCISVKNFG